jgi:hypothetical protein
MIDRTPNMPDARTLREIRLTRRSLKTLAEVPGLGCGGLSPLARIASPPALADRPGLLAALRGLDGDAEWAVPALLDPRLTIALLLGDGDTQLAGQYLWPDPDGARPGFQLSVEAADLVLRGPATVAQAELTLKDFLALGSVAEVDPVHLRASADELWALAALADTHHLAALLRRASRIAGPPAGLRAKDVVRTWQAGLAEPHLGWAVSLFSALAPEAVPADFASRLPGVLAAMARAGLLTALEAEPGDPLGDLYLLGDALEGLCRGRSQTAIQFGLRLQSMREPGRAELLILAGWRTAGGLVAADLSAIAEDRVEVLLLGPSAFAELLETVFHGDPAAPPAERFVPEVRYSRASLLSGLSGSSAPDRCASCAAEVEALASFCHRCGKPLQSAVASATVVLSKRPALKLVCGRGPAVPLKDGLTVGRDTDNDLAIQEASTSRKHAVIEATPAGWLVRDLGSSNGTWLNGARISGITAVEAGDAIVFGKTAFKVEAG